ncbi:reticulon-4 isoform X2 [Mauremys reevesii]|uniref:reticulon-4 isoform X2 n=1 Tax=Mauremys reevesii TaxID=260615 RepID=UPI00193F3A3E|nr:reticulon-4 isoform X2 [Mauremys reevesii]
MDEQDQSPLVSSSGPAQPQQPRFQYQFVQDPEEEEEVEDDDDDFDEQLEVMERKLPAMAAAPAPLLDLGGSEQPRPDRRPPAVSSSSSSPPRSQEPESPAPLPPKPEPPASSPLPAHPAAAPKRRGSSSGCADETLFALPAASEPLMHSSAVVDLLYWRDIKKTGVVFGASLFLLLSLTVFSIVSVTAYIALALLSVTISFRIYKGVIQAIQKSDEGHPFRAYLETDVAVSEELVQKYSNAALGHINGTVKELRRLFLVDDLVDSLKFAVLMWVFTYVGALFNGLTLLILALISLFSVPVIYERHQAQIDHYLGLVNKTARDAVTKIQAKIPGLKRKTE